MYGTLRSVPHGAGSRALKGGESEMERGLVYWKCVQVFFEKENVKSLMSLVFTSQRNTTQKCRLIFENQC